jgi:hypothetical protein
VGHNLEFAGSGKVKKIIWTIMEEFVPCGVTLINRHIEVRYIFSRELSKFGNQWD